jgi:hypothetical protein
MRHPSWQVRLGLTLVIVSVVIYIIHYAIFHDSHHIFIYTLGDLAFLPIEVLLVTLVIHSLLGARERRQRLAKLNMVIGVFFSEVGTELLARVSDADPALEEIRSDLVLKAGWTDDAYRAIDARLRARSYEVDVAKVDLPDLRRFVSDRRDFMLRLLENPTLLEHETFTELLRATFHLTEELLSRTDFAQLPESDLRHLGGDIARAYSRLVDEWLDYMKHLKDDYPYLFSLAIRTNPFDQSASPIVG